MILGEERGRKNKEGRTRARKLRRELETPANLRTTLPVYGTEATLKKVTRRRVEQGVEEDKGNTKQCLTHCADLCE